MFRLHATPCHCCFTAACACLLSVALLTLLEDIEEASVIEHCPDIIAWLEQHTAVLAGPLFASNQQAMQQVGPRLHRRRCGPAQARAHECRQAHELAGCCVLCRSPLPPPLLLPRAADAPVQRCAQAAGQARGGRQGAAADAAGLHHTPV